MKSPAAEGLEFIATFIMVAAPVYLLLTATHSAGLNAVAAQSSAFVLGGSVNVVQDGGEWFLRSQKFDAWISDLCAGTVEIAVMAGAIVASADRSRRQRAKGIVAGLAAVLLFNPLRIAFTLQQSGSLNFAYYHEILFRLALVVFIVSFYAMWYVWTGYAGQQSRFRTSSV